MQKNVINVKQYSSSAYLSEPANKLNQNILVGAASMDGTSIHARIDFKIFDTYLRSLFKFFKESA